MTSVYESRKPTFEFRPNIRNPVVTMSVMLNGQFFLFRVGIFLSFRNKQPQKNDLGHLLNRNVDLLICLVSYITHSWRRNARTNGATFVTRGLSYNHRYTRRLRIIFITRVIRFFRRHPGTNSRLPLKDKKVIFFNHPTVKCNCAENIDYEPYLDCFNRKR